MINIINKKCNYNTTHNNIIILRDDSQGGPATLVSEKNISLQERQRPQLPSEVTSLSDDNSCDDKIFDRPIM